MNWGYQSIKPEQAFYDNFDGITWDIPKDTPDVEEVMRCPAFETMLKALYPGVRFVGVKTAEGKE